MRTYHKYYKGHEALYAKLKAQRNKYEGDGIHRYDEVNKIADHYIDTWFNVWVRPWRLITK